MPLSYAVFLLILLFLNAFVLYKVGHLNPCFFLYVIFKTLDFKWQYLNEITGILTTQFPHAKSVISVNHIYLV